MGIKIQDLLSKCKEMPLDELIKVLESSIPQGFLKFMIPNFKPKGFYRVRPHNSIYGVKRNNELFLFLDEGEFWNTPKELITELGRCNNINKSYLYCSTDVATAIIESKPKTRSYFSVTTFELKDEINFNGSKFNFIGGGYLSQIPSLQHIFEDYKVENQFKELDEFLDSLFHKEVSEDAKYLYKLSIAVTNCMMRNIYDGKNEYLFDGMIYSSIQRNKKNYNLIYRPEHAREHFFVKKIETFELVYDTKFQMQLRLCRTGVINNYEKDFMGNSKIEWSEIQDRFYTILKSDH